MARKLPAELVCPLVLLLFGGSRLVFLSSGAIKKSDYYYLEGANSKLTL